MSDSSLPDGSSSFTAYASKYLTGNGGASGENSAPPVNDGRLNTASPSHDPFLASPSASKSGPHLQDSLASHSTGSGSSTPPFPGMGIDGIPSITSHGTSSDQGSSPEGHVLFDGTSSGATATNHERHHGQRPSVPNPYAASSESEAEMEADLDEVAEMRRSLKAGVPAAPGAVDRGKKGWLAYQSVFPSSSSSESSPSSKGSDDENDHSYGYDQATQGYEVDGVPQLEGGGSALEEPLLGADDVAQLTTRVPVRLQVYRGRFGHWEREGLRKYKDIGFLAIWLLSLVLLMVGLLIVWGSTDPPKSPKRPPPSLLPLLPLLLALLIPAVVLPPVFLFLLSKTVRPVLLSTAVVIPFSLFACGWWAIGASFEGLADPETGGSWWATIGLRLGALFTWLLAAWFARMLWLRRERLHRTVSVVELSTQLLLRHPPLLVMTPLLLAAFAVASIPFMTLLIRLGTIGYWRHPRENTWVFHLRPYAGWLILLVSAVWVWSWGVIRGIGRVAVSAVVGEWYFHRESSYDPLEITTAAAHRATGTSLGSVCLGSLIVASVRVVGRAADELKRLTTPRRLPHSLSFLSRLTPIFSVTASILDQVNGYALVYVGITGEAFWPSARRAVGLARRRRSGQLLDYTLIKLLLTLSSAATALFTATAGYLYMAHSLHNPAYAPVAAVLCGGVPFLAIRTGSAVLTDVADALFICHQIDGEIGNNHSVETKEAFEGEVFREDPIV